MRAIVRERFGPPSEVLELRDVPKPELTDDGVLVRVRAASVNPADLANITAPLFVKLLSRQRKPKTLEVGTDFAGTVEAVGKDVPDVQVGDDVFGGRSGALAEYVNVRAAVAKKPANVSFEEAAATPIAALTALQGLRDKGGMQAGHKVLVNGASGGVGTYAVQIAKAFGADVTAVCSTSKVEIARDIGADRVLDYTREDFTQLDEKFDILFDVAAVQPWSKVKRVLKPDARVVVVGAPWGSSPLGPLGAIARRKLTSIGSSQKVAFFVAKLTREDMNVLADLLESGKVKSVIDRRYELADSAAAFDYLREGHARGKIVVTI